MSKIKFEGFPTGQPVALSAKIGAETRTGNIAAWGGQKTSTSGKSVQIEVIRATGPAPLGAFLEARVSGFDVTGQEAERKLDYVWDFGTPGRTSGALTGRSDALWGRDPNTAYLPRVTHTYDTPGKYTAQVWVSDGVDVVTDQVTIDVADPQTVFPGTRTIYVDPDGKLNVQHPGAPAGAQYAATTAEAYAKWLEFDSAGGRVLFARGKTHDPFPDQFTAAKHVALGAYGTGAKPVIDCRSADGARPTEHVLSFACADLHFVGTWNASTETGGGRDGISGNVDTYTVIHNNEFTNLGAAMQFNAEATDVDWYAQISNNRIHGWQNYGILLPRPLFFGLVGNEIKQDPEARGGGLGKGVTSNWHGPIRTSAPRKAGWTTMRMNEMFSASSWTVADGRPSHQPCIRWNSSGGKDGTAFFERNILEGGRQVMSFDPGSSGWANRNHILFQMNYLLRSANSENSAINIQFTGVVVRNNVIVTPRVFAEANDSLSPPLTVIRSGYKDADHQAALVEIYNNTHVDLRTDVEATLPGKTAPATLRWFQGGDGNLPANVFLENNAEAAPFRTDRGDTVVDSAKVLFAPYYRGLKWASEPVLDQSFATPPDSAIAATPAVASSGLTGRTAIRDLMGTVRPTDASVRTVGARQHTP